MADKRPLGIAALQDKRCPASVVTVLNAIYEFSYGFGQGLRRKPVNWVLDLDVRGFFDTVSHEWLVKFVEHRIADRRILRLIRKRLKAGVSEEREWTETKIGTPQRRSSLAAFGEHISALRLRSLGEPVAEEVGAWEHHDCGSLRR